MSESPIELDEFGKVKGPERWKSVVSVVIIVILAILALRVFFALLMPIISLILLIANRDLVAKIVRSIVGLYNDEMYKGLLATIAAVLAFPPFMVFLFFRTVYHMFVTSGEEPSSIKEEESGGLESELINIAVKKKVKDWLVDDDDDKNIQHF